MILVIEEIMAVSVIEAQYGDIQPVALLVKLLPQGGANSEPRWRSGN